RVERSDLRRGNSEFAGAPGDAAACCAELDDDDRPACAPEREGAIQVACARVKARFAFVDEHDIERVDEIREARVACEHVVPAEIPGCGDPTLVERVHAPGPGARLAR